MKKFSSAFMLISVFFTISFSSCNWDNPDKICFPGDTMCTDDTSRIKVCSSDGKSWVLESCGANYVCEEDSCVPLIGGDVSITTETLPEGKNDQDYETVLEAIGGLPPYAWQLLDGTLPEGLHLDSNGTLWGITSEVGTFPITIRVIDGSTPPVYDTVDFDLIMNVSPLEITGDTVYSMGPAKIVVLPLLIPYAAYDTQLKAKGGMKPYLWEETQPPAIYQMYISDWGLPPELAMTEDGRIVGTVTNTSDAVTVSIPGSGTTLTGYFLYLKVTDSQDPPKSAATIFLIPTIPM